VSDEAKNLKAIQAAVVQHNGNCPSPLAEIRMNPFEIERLGWENFRGIPIKPDEKLGTGTFRLVCEGMEETHRPPAGTKQLPRELRELAPVA
jgi:hypothetical protein